MDEHARINGEQAAYQMPSSYSESSSGEIPITPVDQIHTTVPEEPPSRRESRHSYVQLPPAPVQVNGPRRAQPVTFPDVSVPTVNGIVPQDAPSAPRVLRTAPSPTTGTQAIPTIPLTIQERRRQRHRRYNRSGLNQSGAQLSPHAPAFVPLSIPTTQAAQQYRGGAPVVPATGDDRSFYERRSYIQSAPPAHLYPQQFPQQHQQPSPLTTGLYSGYRSGGSNSQPGSSTYSSSQYLGPTPPPSSLTSGSSYQGYQRGATPPPGLGSSVGSLPSGPPVLPARPQRVFQNQGAAYEYARPLPLRQWTEEQSREERIRIHRERDERARGFDERDDDEFIPGL
ncbi:uncharacterized protein F4807DRAFT_455833 [Annulohypoxylon truncatum]|uniref:uncharacterized protein n=1 Tax=Annulohypoxylon truncatum TaxID=327061 RepID=UPI0020085DDF|nr:uncharacterized protein F4807DRAFT_455833 [Annulohypoxylon truncatum]KAI1214188.1 hypothetical protein F4807DRAFT_455833 [Annulohypoxylon truncatum]